MAHNKKILFTSSDKFPPFRVDVSVLFGDKLVSRGYKIDWVLQSEKDCDRAYCTEWNGGMAWVGATDNGVSRWRRLQKHVFNIGNQLRVLRLAREQRYDIILVKDLFLTALPAMWAAKRSGANFIYWLSYPFPEASIHRAKEGSARYRVFYFARGHFFKWLLYKVLMPTAIHVFVQSEQMKKDVASEGVPPGKLTAVPMGVDQRNIPCAEQLPSRIDEGNEKRVLYLGTLAKVRHLDFLIRAFAKVLQKFPDAKLYLVGAGDDPSDDELLLAEAKRLGVVDSIVMTGFLPMKEAWGYVRDARVCVSPFFPSFILNSTSPTKLIEYMAMGKPVVANDHPEQRLVLSESGGGISVPYDEFAFSAAIIELLSDPVKACAMGENGRTYVMRTRSYDALGEMVDGKLQAIVGDRKS